MQYALAVAGQADDFHERALGPIHLIKYLYLADLDYAKFHGGLTFTGIDWTFHHFGPWSAVAYRQMEEALSSIGAKKTTIPSGYGDKDFIRWCVRLDAASVDALRNGLPLEIRHSIQHYVCRYHNNTAALLHFVYATPPMLRAAPEELLDFSVAIPEKKEKAEPPVPFFQRLTPQKQKALTNGMAELRKRFSQKIASVPGTQQRLTVRPDAVFEAGVAWLDKLAGEEFPEHGATVQFTKEVWKSDARSGDVGLSPRLHPEPC
jgi:hypothetical protein